MATEIREVWASNLEEEFLLIREIVDHYPYVALDTEYPGVVVRPLGADDYWNPDHQYKQLNANVNLLKLIQLGFTFSDRRGNLPTCGRSNKIICAWQFNFGDFDPQRDMHDLGSIAMLREKAGIDLEKNRREGVDSRKFGDLLMSSGVVLNSDVTWVTFQGGYDFGYLLRLLKGMELPDEPKEFFEWLNVFCPVVYDLKYLMKVCDVVPAGRGGLDKLAGLLRVERVAGVSHQAGSDSFLTSSCFLRLLTSYSLHRYAGILQGLQFQ